MAKFYFTQLAARPLKLSGRPFRFLICSQISGRATGVYESQSDEEQEILDRAVNERRGISEIGLEEYESLKKKATLTLQSPRRGGSPPKSIVIPQVQPGPRDIAMDRAGVTSAALEKQPDEQAIASAPAIKSLIVERKINSPKPFAAADEKTSKAAKRAGAAKIRVARKAVDTA